MKILLDIDGVLVTTPAWRVAEQDIDGFLKFNERAVKNLIRLVDETQASIILTTTHRINYSLSEWRDLLKTRGINPLFIEKINEITILSEMSDRATEIKEWVDKHRNEHFLIIDDDLSINNLPTEIKEKCVLTKSMIGLDEEATTKAFNILLKK